jgi:aromatic ring-opening dioxygenase LigB subunit
VKLKEFVKKRLTDEEISKAMTVAKELAKNIFRKRYNEDRTEKIVNNILQGNKEKNLDAIISIINNTFKK